MLGLGRKKSGKCRRRKTVAGKCHANVIYLWTSKGLMDAMLCEHCARDGVKSIDAARRLYLPPMFSDRLPKNYNDRNIIDLVMRKIERCDAMNKIATNLNFFPF